VFELQSLSRPVRIIVGGALAALLAACNAQAPSAAAPPGAPRGSLTLSSGSPASSASSASPVSSAESGSITLTTTTCAFAGGKPNAFDGAASGAGSVSGAASGSGWRVRITTSAHPAGYAAEGLTGVTTTKAGDTWTVTLTGLRLPAIDQPDTVLQVSGTVLCSA
jgi:hypothetical protein